MAKMDNHLPKSDLSFYINFSLSAGCMATGDKDYVSQPFLQLGGTMWLSSGQEDKTGGEEGHFCIVPLKGTLPQSHWLFLTYIVFFFKCAFILFIYFWLCWVFVAMRLSLVVVSRGYSLMWCKGFSLPWLLSLCRTPLGHADFSSCSTRALGHRLNGCGSQA